MSGIGRHKFSTNNQSVWKPDLAICPYCGDAECDADWVSVGVGLVQSGPYHCIACGAIEIGAYDNQLTLDDKEQETGWYKPNRPYEGCANTINGQLVGHDEAMDAYRSGALDIR